MRVAALYDVHGNLPALDAVLADVAREDVDAIVCGGDVLWGAYQSECMTALRARDARFVAGNCERDVVGAVDDSSAWCRERLGDEDLEEASGWAATLELEVTGIGPVLFCHATPHSLDEIVTRLTPDEDVAASLHGVDVDVVVCGHTHVQYDRPVPGGRRLVNAGSVGMPYQGEPGAFWAILGPTVELRRTEYDVDAALASLTSSGFPSAAEIYGNSIRGVASAESATAYFESKRRGA
jgi:predicted phosphodiesterase